MLLFLIDCHMVKLSALNEHLICTYFCLGSISPLCSVDGPLETISFDKVSTSQKKILLRRKLIGLTLMLALAGVNEELLDTERSRGKTRSYEK